MTEKFMIGEALSFAWQKVRGRIFFFAGVFLLLYASQVPLQILSQNEGENTSAGFIILMIVTFFVQLLFGTGVIRIMLDVVDKKTPSFESLYSQYLLLFRYLLTTIVIVIITAIGTILLIVPGIIWAIKYQFAPYIVIDKKAGVFEALAESGKITKGQIWKLFVFALASAGIYILGFLALGIGILIAAPVVSLALAYIYRKLEKSKEEKVDE